MPLKKWEPHISNTLRKYEVEPYDDKPQVEVTTSKDGKEVLVLCFSDITQTPWIVSKDPKLKQYSEFNCGPIECLKVLEVYGIITGTVAPASIMQNMGTLEL